MLHTTYTYLRPILLFQAQDIKGEITVEKLKDNLVNVQGLPAEEIAVATGDQKELDGVNISQTRRSLG